MYSQADLYVFDDPLSAIDSRQQRQIFESCVLGILRHKTVIMTCTAIHLLHYVRVVVLDDDLSSHRRRIL